MFGHDNIAQFTLILVMNKVTARSIWAETDSVERTAQIRLVFRMSGQAYQENDHLLSLSSLHEINQ